MPHDKVVIEARARIIWGDSPASVRDYLVSNGISSSVADAKLVLFNLERDRELRRMGFRNLWLGVLLTTASGIAFWMARLHGTPTSGIVKGLAWVLIIGCYGLWKLVNGIIYLVRPQSEHKSLPDIKESDIMD